jgi:flavin-dependent dehydrogenase
MVYDVVVAGASFAGLAFATNLKTKKVLLIDRKKPGTLVTSACAAPLNLLENRGLEKAIIQQVKTVEFSTGYGKIQYKTQIPFVTFDYQTFCQTYFNRFEGEFKKENIVNFNGEKVITDKGEHCGKVFIDATGWSAKLVSSLKPDFYNRQKLGFGIETELPYSSSKLHFIFDPKVIKGGYAWIFPIGQKSRFGLGTYQNRTDLKGELSKFIQGYGFALDGQIHGGFMPYGLRSPTFQNVFLIGDSAGQIVPLTGEGIRQAIYFAEECARLVQQYLDGEISLEKSLINYRHFVLKHRSGYFLFHFLQKAWLTIPNFLLQTIASVLGRPWPCQLAQKLYFKWMYP